MKNIRRVYIRPTSAPARTLWLRRAGAAAEHFTINIIYKNKRRSSHFLSGTGCIWPWERGGLIKQPGWNYRPSQCMAHTVNVLIEGGREGEQSERGETERVGKKAGAGRKTKIWIKIEPKADGVNERMRWLDYFHHFLPEKCSIWHKMDAVVHKLHHRSCIGAAFLLTYVYPSSQDLCSVSSGSTSCMDTMTPNMPGLK